MNFRIVFFNISVLVLTLPPALFAETPAPLTIDQTSVSIRADGHLEEWPSARMFLLNQKDQIVSGKNLWKGDEDFSGRIFLTYDEQFLYLGAIVQKKDKKVVNDNGLLSLPNGDCVELFLSTAKVLKHQDLFTRGDYHLAFSPGTACKNAQVYCLNKNSTVPGGRLIARVTTNGYILEACVPLAFFQGLEMGPGKEVGLALALDEGGEVSGNRIVQMVHGGDGVDLEDPASWPRVQWTGKLEADIPFKTVSDLYANLVLDGTQGASYAGQRPVTGLVQDEKGKPLAGVRITTWPKKGEATTGADGRFVLPKQKLYAQTVLYTGKRGYVSTLVPLPAKGVQASIRMVPVPPAWTPAAGTIGPYFIGLTLPALAPEPFHSFLDKAKDLILPLKPGMLRLALPVAPLSAEDHLRTMDLFVEFAKGLGAEPMIAVPLDGDPAAYVRHFKKGTSSTVRYWSIGDEPDRGPGAGDDNSNSYTYLNHFRIAYNAMKREDPGLFILGPETGEDQVRGERDWVTPLVRYDGDALNALSIHRYAAFKDGVGSAQSLEDALRHELDVLGALSDRISENSDLELPIAITGGAARSKPATGSMEEKSLQEFWDGLFSADQRGLFLKGGLAVDLAGSLWADTADLGQLKPAYWALRLWGQMKRGKVLTAISQDAHISVYATQDSTSKDVTLLIVNKSDHYWKPKILLNGEESSLTVEAGMDQRYDFESPSLSISLLTLKADRSEGQAQVYSSKMARAGEGPKVSSLKAW